MTKPHSIQDDFRLVESACWDAAGDPDLEARAALRRIEEQFEALRSAAEDSLSILDSLKGGLAFSRGEVIARLREALASSPASKENLRLEEQLEAAVPQWLYDSKVDELRSVEEQFEALRLAATRQLTPLDVAATHIDILRRKSEDYTSQERDNVAAIVESHVKEARTALFAAISNPAMRPSDG